MATLAHNTARSGPDRDVPVVIEDDTNFPFEDGERENDWHEASGAEVAAYKGYWDGVLDRVIERRKAQP